MGTPIVTLSVPLGTVLRAGTSVDIDVLITNASVVDSSLQISDFTLTGGTLNSVGGSGGFRSVNITLPSSIGNVVLTLNANSIQESDPPMATGPAMPVTLTLPVVDGYMTFFSDALDGYNLHLDPAETAPMNPIRFVNSGGMALSKSDAEAASVCFDKKVRTGIKSSSSITVRLDWSGSTSYDVVVLVLNNTTSWSIQPDGQSSPNTGNLISSSRQFVYQEYNSPITSTRLTVILSNGGELQEIYLLKKMFAVNDSETVLGREVKLERPMRYRNYATDPGEQAYRSEDQTLISYSGLSPYGKALFSVGWDYLQKVWVDKFRDLFFGPPLRKPFFFYPEPVEYPNEVYRVYFESSLDRPGDRYRMVDGFAPYPTAASLASGYSLDMNFIET